MTRGRKVQLSNFWPIVTLILSGVLLLDSGSATDVECHELRDSVACNAAPTCTWLASDLVYTSAVKNTLAGYLSPERDTFKSAALGYCLSYAEYWILKAMNGRTLGSNYATAPPICIAVECCEELLPEDASIRTEEVCGRVEGYEWLSWGMQLELGDFSSETVGVSMCLDKARHADMWNAQGFWYLDSSSVVKLHFRCEMETTYQGCQELGCTWGRLELSRGTPNGPHLIASGCRQTDDEFYSGSLSNLESIDEFQVEIKLEGSEGDVAKNPASLFIQDQEECELLRPDFQWCGWGVQGSDDAVHSGGLCLEDNTENRSICNTLWFRKSFDMGTDWTVTSVACISDRSREECEQACIAAPDVEVCDLMPNCIWKTATLVLQSQTPSEVRSVVSVGCFSEDLSDEDLQLGGLAGLSELSTTDDQAFSVVIQEGPGVELEDGSSVELNNRKSPKALTIHSKTDCEAEEGYTWCSWQAALATDSSNSISVGVCVEVANFAEMCASNGFTESDETIISIDCQIATNQQNCEELGCFWVGIQIRRGSYNESQLLAVGCFDTEAQSMGTLDNFNGIPADELIGDQFVVRIVTEGLDDEERKNIRAFTAADRSGCAGNGNYYWCGWEMEKGENVALGGGLCLEDNTENLSICNAVWFRKSFAIGHEWKVKSVACISQLFWTDCLLFDDCVWKVGLLTDWAASVGCVHNAKEMHMGTLTNFENSGTTVGTFLVNFREFSRSDSSEFFPKARNALLMVVSNKEMCEQLDRHFNYRWCEWDFKLTPDDVTHVIGGVCLEDIPMNIDVCSSAWFRSKFGVGNLAVCLSNDPNGEPIEDTIPGRAHLCKARRVTAIKGGFGVKCIEDVLGSTTHCIAKRYRPQPADPVLDNHSVASSDCISRRNFYECDAVDGCEWRALRIQRIYTGFGFDASVGCYPETEHLTIGTMDNFTKISEAMLPQSFNVYFTTKPFADRRDPYTIKALDRDICIHYSDYRWCEWRIETDSGAPAEPNRSYNGGACIPFRSYFEVCRPRWFRSRFNLNSRWNVEAISCQTQMTVDECQSTRDCEWRKMIVERGSITEDISVGCSHVNDPRVAGTLGRFNAESDTDDERMLNIQTISENLPPYTPARSPWTLILSSEDECHRRFDSPTDGRFVFPSSSTDASDSTYFWCDYTKSKEGVSITGGLCLEYNVNYQDLCSVEWIRPFIHEDAESWSITVSKR